MPSRHPLSTSPRLVFNRQSLIVLLAGTLIAISGCAKDAACRVSGKVTLDGTPWPKA